MLRALLPLALICIQPVHAKQGEGTKHLKIPTSEALYGDLWNTSVVNEAAARSFMQNQFQIDPATLTLKSQVSSPLGTHFTFAQIHRGVPVYGVEVKVHFNQSGKVVATSSNYVTAINLAAVAPSVSRQQARERFRATVNGEGEDQGAQLFVYAADDTFRLVWEVTRAGTGPSWRGLIDAHSGQAVQEAEDANRYAQGSGRVFMSNAIVATHITTLKDQRDSAAAVPANAYSLVTLLGLDGTGFLDGSFASSRKTRKRAQSPTLSFLFDRSDDGFSETMAYYYLDHAERYIQSLGFNTVNNRQQVFSVNTYKQDNSYYSPTNKEITFGTGGVDDAEDGEVILHEYGHSIQDNQVPGFGGTNESGAMGEGFGDYWAASVGSDFSGDYLDACVAEWDSVAYTNDDPPCLRRLDTTKHYPQDVTNEVHADGEIWSGALWQIFQALGKAKSDTLILQHHFLLAANATFYQAADALIVAAINLGYGASDVTAIRTILTTRGFTVTQ